VEAITLSVRDRLALAGLYKELEIAARPEELDAKAPEFFAALKKLAEEAGGEAPAPARPSLTDIEEIEARIGNERLAALRAKVDDLKARIGAWKKTRDLIGKRLPAWRMLDRLAAHAAGLPEAKSWLDQREAIRSGRLLLAEPDRVAPVVKGLAGLLRQALNTAHAGHEAAYESAMATLAADAVWNRISAADQARILAEVGLEAPGKPDIGSDEALVAALDSKRLADRRAEADAIPVRVQRALQQAAQRLEPKVQFVAVDRALLRSEADVDAWLASQRQRLVEALQNGPVQVQ
jgi:hypothetical protein